MKIGKKLKALRKGREMTLGELSRKSGVQTATLSRMENDVMTGTLASHISICKALGVSLSDFYRELEEEHKTVSLGKQKKTRASFVRSGKSTTEMLTTKIAEKKMMPFLVKIQKNGKTHREKDKIGTEKFIYVLEGKIRAKIGNEIYALSKGDSIYLDASLPHVFHNSAKRETRLFSIVSPAAA